MHLVAPRLSMVPGPLSSREAVAAWRRWEPKRSVETTESNPVTLVISVEDTGAPSFFCIHVFFPVGF